MTEPIVIVSIAPWARRGAWWRNANLALRAERLERPAELLMRYFLSGCCETAALSLNEATLLRGWATTVPGWDERAAQSQLPLRFAGYAIDDQAIRRLR